MFVVVYQRDGKWRVLATFGSEERANKRAAKAIRGHLSRVSVWPDELWQLAKDSM